MEPHADSDAALRRKLAQASAVIAHLVGMAGVGGPEGRRAVDYFSTEGYDPAFLPWPRHEEEGTRPENLDASNDG